jgi:DNA sulfur modification protein DndD
VFRLRSLQVENFGPYKGVQRITFPGEDGVVMVYGENMRGKTTLLNAIRFAFFGKFLDRGSQEIPLYTIGNWEAAEEGTYGFEVRLDMIHEGVKYRLTRSCTVRPQVSEPKSDDDFEVHRYLEKDGVPLGPNETTRELERILPEQISRFFLFDGELLKEYEELLLDESTAGDHIAKAIERVLGMPILTNARTTLASAKELAQKEQASAAQGDQRTRQFGVLLEQLLAEHEVLIGEMQRLDAELIEMRSHRARLDERMRKSERIRAILEKKDALEEEMTGLEQKIGIEESALQTAMAGAWSVVLRQRMKTTLAAVRSRHRELQNAILRHGVIKDLAERHLEQCPTCGQDVADAAREHLKSLLGPDFDEKEGVGLNAEMTAVGLRMAALESQIDRTSPQALQVLIDNLEDTRRTIHTKRGEIKDLKTQLEEVNEENVRQLRHDYEAAIRETQAIEEGLKKTREKLDANSAQREGLQAKVAKNAGNSVVAAQEYLKLCTDLHDLFDQAIAEHRDRLRHRVEADATKHFLSLTTEEEYVGLRINDSYGLSIVHKNGSNIRLRSAGAEHIVAFALIAALQNNAPLRGPIIIDSALIRLDGGHKENILRALPTFADQVLMLVYEDEVSPTRARNALKGRLRGEFKLKRVSARHTKLSEEVDA